MNNSRPVIIWLFIGLVMTMVMLIIGGVTRLTGSGLSMVDWNLFMGTIPPLSQEEWEATFSAYQQHAEYKIINTHMTLEEFKGIFFWEYFHRLWGRLIGIVFLVPFIYFVIKKYITGPMLYKVGALFILGGLQGMVGWIMVLSGLGDEPHVSHYKLTLHLMTALVLITYILWLIKLYSKEGVLAPKMNYYKTAQKWLGVYLIVLILQLVYGGFMAGKKASLFYPTFPDMNGMYYPDNMFVKTPSWLNFFENVTTIHFVHRLLPVLLLVLLGFFIAYLVRSEVTDARLRRLKNLILLNIIVQIILGALTVIYTEGKIPVVWAELHQVFGVLLFMLSFYCWLYMKRVSKKGLYA